MSACLWSYCKLLLNTPKKATPPATTYDLDTLAEMSARLLLLAILQRNLGKYGLSHNLLNSIIDGPVCADPAYTYVRPYALSESATTTLLDMDAGSEVFPVQQKHLLLHAQQQLGRIAKCGEFDIDTRLHFRVQALLCEIKARQKPFSS